MLGYVLGLVSFCWMAVGVERGDYLRDYFLFSVTFYTKLLKLTFVWLFWATGRMGVDKNIFQSSSEKVMVGLG